MLSANSTGRIQLDVAAGSAQDTFLVNICYVGAATWLAYDILLTIRKEIAYVWSSRWTIAKVLYLLLRYYTLFSMILSIVASHSTKVSSKLCQRWPLYPALAGPTMTALFAEALAGLRIYALYIGSRKVLVLIGLLYLGQITATIAVFVLSSKAAGDPSGCLVSTQPIVSLDIVWGISLSVAFIYFALILHKFVNSYPRNYRPSFSKLHKLAPVFYLCMRDGVLYALIVFVGLAVNMVFIVVFHNREIATMLFFWLMALYGIMPSRLHLNLHHTLGEPIGGDLMELQPRSVARGLVFAARSGTSVNSSDSKV